MTEEPAENGEYTLTQKLRMSMRKKLETGMYELELLSALKTEKLNILENLIEEQEFKVSFNSINPQERILKDFADT